MLGVAPKVRVVHITEGDIFTLVVERNGEVLPTPITFWYPDGKNGKTITLKMADDKRSAGLVLFPAEVDELIKTLQRNKQKPQIDFGQIATTILDFKIHLTARPNVQEES